MLDFTKILTEKNVELCLVALKCEIVVDKR